MTAALPAAGATTTRTPIPNTAPRWLAHAHRIGAASLSAPVSARVYLAPNGGLGAVRSYALAVSTPGSAGYHHFLTPAAYYARFGTRSAAVSRVKSWLTGAGLRVTGVAAHNRYVVVSGTVAAAQKAFGVRINRYSHNGLTVQAPASRLTAPSGVASSVLTVSGIDTTPHVTRPASSTQITQPSGFRNAHPCSAYYGEIPASTKADGTTPLPTFDGQTLPYAPCGYTGTQFRSAYENNSTLDGTGITVAITDAYASPSIASDAATYAARHGDRAYGEGQLTQTLPTDISHAGNGQCGASGWYGEETLDVEAVHAMAQGANIHYYGANSCYDTDLLDTLAQVVTDGTAQLVTNSWSDVESNETADNVAAYEAVFLQGATEGMSFMFSSGDDGDELAATGTKQVDYPSSDPYVTSVGGTTTAIGQTGNLEWSTGWGTDKYKLSSDGTSWSSIGFIYGSGGGTSMLFDRPAYQDGVVTDSHRQEPDVAMDADPTTGMLVGETQKFPKGVVAYDEYRIGGTSLASPLFAGMTALAVQNAGSGAGLLNPVIYSHTSAFTDVAGSPPDAGNVRADYANGVDASAGIVYSVRTFDQDSSLSVTPGYDLVTGLGVPNTGWLTAIG
ncbi:MAG TPA: S53 family peptidase [Mycobacteriales bacterium]|nr:S53 family peptidase [Mycobacteriales bacterium]